MGYIIQEPDNFINVKLTDTGRQLLSLGTLAFKKVILSDREINYKMGRLPEYDLCNNRILNVRDVSPLLPTTNFDNTAAITLSSSELGSVRQIVSADTEETGFFFRTGSTEDYEIITGITESNRCLGLGIVTVNNLNHSIIDVSGYSAETGQLIYIPWEPFKYLNQANNKTNKIPQNLPSVGLWYRAVGVTGGTTIELDRPAAYLSDLGVIGKTVNAYFYPYNGVETHYGNSELDSAKVWNMNINRTTSVIGTVSSMKGYESYGSIEYAGTKKYLGFNDGTKAFGIVHYTNRFTGNTYAEQFVEKTVELTVPNIMWHKNSTASLPGTEMQQGIVLYDVAGETFADNIAGTTYRVTKTIRTICQ